MDSSTPSLLWFIAGVVVVFLLYWFWSRGRFELSREPSLQRAKENPILKPVPGIAWEDAAVFNPTAWYDGAHVHLLYRALGHEGISRIGYAVSDDGIHFTRGAEPAFAMHVPPPAPAAFKNPFADSDRTYDRDRHASGGGWGGSEDPRLVAIDGRAYLTFGVFESWHSLRIALTSLSVPAFQKNEWNWAPYFFISPAEETHKNWVLFPEKINGKFALLHALTPHVMISYADSPDEWMRHPVASNNKRSGRKGHWDAFVRGAAAPPIKTEDGWLLLYHGMNPETGHGYNVGAMLLDLNDPTKILYRSAAPILTPREWYENDWKPGVVYASGAIVKDGTLFVYYGGGDKYVNVATAPLALFIAHLKATGLV
jgi:beta-1,2-mannobiose phosphorylase / 1,2-beta-oligomannan phosphorylase